MEQGRRIETVGVGRIGTGGGGDNAEGAIFVEPDR
jgi:hypothetical protein